MVRKRVTTRLGNRVVGYTTKKEAERAKDRAPGSNRIYKIKHPEKLWVVKQVK